MARSRTHEAHPLQTSPTPFQTQQADPHWQWSDTVQFQHTRPKAADWCCLQHGSLCLLYQVGMQ